MTVEEVTYYRVRCDVCGETPGDQGAEFSAWAGPDGAVDGSREEEGWEKISVPGLDVCAACAGHYERLFTDATDALSEAACAEGGHLVSWNGPWGEGLPYRWSCGHCGRTEKGVWMDEHGHAELAHQRGPEAEWEWREELLRRTVTDAGPLG